MEMQSQQAKPVSLSRRQWCAAAAGLLVLAPGLAIARVAEPAAAAQASPPPNAHGSRRAAPMLAQEWEPGTDPTGWLVSEKFDGVRALWDGKQLRFRSGREIAAPAWFVKRLPVQALDGELWLARGRFDALSSIVRSKEPDDAAWRELSYQVFELPGAGGVFEARADSLAKLAAATRWPQLRAVPQLRFADDAALQRKLAEVVAAGGEGLMLHQAIAPEVSGRSPLLRKLKPLHDAEAVVVGHVAGQGRLADKLGALQVETPDGKRFQIGTGFSDAQRTQPPAIGSHVTYTYRGLTGQGLPRFASFLREAPKF